MATINKKKSLAFWAKTQTTTTMKYARRFFLGNFKMHETYITSLQMNESEKNAMWINGQQQQQQ